MQQNASPYGRQNQFLNNIYNEKSKTYHSVGVYSWPSESGSSIHNSSTRPRHNNTSGGEGEKYITNNTREISKSFSNELHF